MKRSKLCLSRITLGLYGLILIWIVLFKISFTLEDISAMVSPRTFNLIPFYYENDVGLRFHIEEVLLNIIIFAPLGLLLCLNGAGLGKSLLIGFGLCLSLETLQLISALGAFDITDIITNTAGTVLGAVFYLLLARISKNKKRTDKVLLILLLIAISLFLSLGALLFIANL